MTYRTLLAGALLLCACPNGQAGAGASATDATTTDATTTEGTAGAPTTGPDTVLASVCDKRAAAIEATAMLDCGCSVDAGLTADVDACVSDIVAAANIPCQCDLEADPTHAAYLACLAEADVHYQTCVEPLACAEEDARLTCNTTYVEAVAACDEAAKASVGALAVQCQGGAAFTCSTGETVADHYACDGQPDCKDMSDEAKATCTFVCDDGQEILVFNKCDGTVDCDDSSDESPELCYFSCDDGLEIPKTWICDGSADCDDMTDEANCP
ncbi:hypothetical protein [Nannocystis radixulma]|uniref:Low-density lipoprotein receptor domain class A n=1 Tax=Nannocystis radixulma TaxID=2995305 RepID=A0ABT5BQH4_9BACT|nr:hypothetical protein [Nannocystis radixulma]MDC0675247.1 hypothetical protein [Nannocystis radixulma]